MALSRALTLLTPPPHPPLRSVQNYLLLLFSTTFSSIPYIPLVFIYIFAITYNVIIDVIRSGVNRCDNWKCYSHPHPSLHLLFYWYIWIKHYPDINFNELFIWCNYLKCFTAAPAQHWNVILYSRTVKWRKCCRKLLIFKNHLYTIREKNS